MSLAMSGCSPGADYPSIFQAVHNTPPPGADTTLDADQVQQATETLITERNQLSAAAQASGQTKNSGQFIESRRRRQRPGRVRRRRRNQMIKFQS